MMMTYPLTSSLPTPQANPLTQPLPPSSPATLAFEKQVHSFSASFPAHSAYQLWLVQQLARNSMIVDQCREEEAFHLERLARRAQVCWHDDRRLEAEETGSRIAKDPSRTMRQLQNTLQGCHWLLERWDCLLQLMRETGEWTAEQLELARHMLGQPLVFGNVTGVLDGATPEETRAARLQIAEGQITRLIQRIEERLDGLDSMEQSAAARGQSVRPDKALRDCRRLEAAANRRIEWILNQLSPNEEAAPATPAVPDAHPEDTANADDAEYQAFAAAMDAKLDTSELERRTDEVFGKHRNGAASSTPTVMTGKSSLASATGPARPMNRRQRRAMKARNAR